MTRMKMTFAVLALAASLGTMSVASAATPKTIPNPGVVCQKDITSFLGQGTFNFIAVKEWQDTKGNPLDRRNGDTELYLSILSPDGSSILSKDTDPPQEERIQLPSDIITLNDAGDINPAADRKFEALLTKLRRNHGALVLLDRPNPESLNARLFIPGGKSCWQSKTITFENYELPFSVNF